MLKKVSSDARLVARERGGRIAVFGADITKGERRVVLKRYRQTVRA